MISAAALPIAVRRVGGSVLDLWFGRGVIPEETTQLSPGTKQVSEQ